MLTDLILIGMVSMQSSYCQTNIDFMVPETLPLIQARLGRSCSRGVTHLYLPGYPKKVQFSETPCMLRDDQTIREGVKIFKKLFDLH